MRVAVAAQTLHLADSRLSRRLAGFQLGCSQAVRTTEIEKSMELILLLVVGVPIALVVWLIVRAVQARQQIDELSRRVGNLELEVFRLKREPAAAPTEQLTPETQTSAATKAQPEISQPPVASPLEPPLIVPTTEIASPPPIPPLVPPLPEPGPLPTIAPPPILPAAEPISKLANPPEAPSVVEPTLSSISETPPILAEVAAAKPTEAPPSEPAPPSVTERASFEMRLGTYWAVRVGAVMLLTGLAFFGNLAYQKFSAGGKVALLYLASGLLLGAGAWWQRKVAKESLKNFGQVLFAGGLAAVYFTTFAAHHVAELRVIQSAMLDGVLLLAWAGFIAWIADRRKSEVLALFAVGLAYYSGLISHEVGAFTLYSNLVLTVVAVFFLVRNRWAWLSFASLLATYAAYAFWRFYHGGEWRLTTPEEGLWHGAYFLMCYWAVFTAAVFLSKHEKLVGSNRAGFITMNNGAFFTLFLLTMLQVHHGGFWKFTLAYGTVLLALVEVSRRLLPSEPLAKNSYLTQGLLLVTVGFISKFAGLQLALLLGAESVVLLVLGLQRGSLILQIGSYLSGALSVAWAFDGVERFDSRGLWLGPALGGLMAFNSFWSRRKTPEAERGQFCAVPAFFATLALVVWCFTTWQNTQQMHFGLVLTLEALVLALSFYVLRLPELTLLGQTYLLAAQSAWAFGVPTVTAQLTALALTANSFVVLRPGWKRNDLALQATGCISAALAVAWGFAGLERNLTTGLITGSTLAVLMLAQAFFAHRRTTDENPDSLRPGPTYFSAMAVVLVITTTWFNTSQANCGLFLATEALVLTATIYFLRVREVALLGQLLLVAGHCAWQFNLFDRGAPPWWNPVLMIAMTLGLGHWWQKQKVVAAKIGMALQLLLSLLFATLVCTWLGKESSASTWLALSCGFAVVVTVYAVATRAWLLAACAQLFLLPGAWLFLRQLAYDGGPKFAALAPIAALGALSLGTLFWFERKPEASQTVRNPLLAVATAYRWVALAMSLWWVLEYVARREQVWVLMAIGVLVFLFAGWRRSREALLFGATFSAMALLLFWARSFEFSGDVYLPSGLAILALLAQQRTAKRLPERYAVDSRIHAATIVLGGLTLWRFVSCWIMKHGGGFYLTVSWSVLALVLFACGVVLRERMYRWLGLGVIAAALGRVVIFDVWKQETIFRVLTFTALGIVLIVVSFIYNKYQEKIRQWL